jgi:hypothetical protein
MLKAATMMIVYAAALLLVGVITFMVAPPGSHPLTALLIPGVCAALMVACAVLTIMGAGQARNGRGVGKQGMLGVHLGILLPLLFTLAFLIRAIPATNAYLEVKSALNPDQPVAAATAVLDEDSRKAFSKDYLAVALWSLTALSSLGFASLLVLRPKMEKTTTPAPAE